MHFEKKESRKRLESDGDGMREISDLHPRLQEKIAELKALVRKELKIEIGISECLRTVAEQDDLYAKGRTAAGSIVTNCRGNTYSSMHQWGVAFDFYLKCDVDKDGQTTDDAFNNRTKLFNKIGAIGERIGLEWGGSWKSIVDLPHFQLPDWGSTATKLKSAYGTPEKFFKTWDTSKVASNATVTSRSTNTSKASFKKLIMELQQALNKEFKAKLTVNGVADEKLLAVTPIFSKAISKNKPLTTAVLKALLQWHNCNCGKVNTVWGKQTTVAVGTFQTTVAGLKKADYVFSAKGKSWKKLLNL